MNTVAFQFGNSRVKGSCGGERAQSEGMMKRSVLVMKLSEQRRGSMLMTVRYKHQKGGFLLFAHDSAHSLVGEVTVATSRSRQTQVTKHAR